jgi:hypothetical protein
MYYQQRAVVRRPWHSGAAAPFLSIEKRRGVIEVCALGGDRFAVRAPGHEQLVTGFEEAQQAAHALAEGLVAGGRFFAQEAERVADLLDGGREPVNTRPACKILLVAGLRLSGPPGCQRTSRG